MVGVCFDRGNGQMNSNTTAHKRRLRAHIHNPSHRDLYYDLIDLKDMHSAWCLLKKSEKTASSTRCTKLYKPQLLPDAEATPSFAFPSNE